MLSIIATFQEPVQKFYGALSKWGGALLLLGFRVHVAHVFFNGGLVKISSWDSTLFLFREVYSVPLLPTELAAYFGTFGELFFPVLLVLGVLSRPAALGLFFVNIVAVVSYPVLLDATCSAAINEHITWGIMLLVVMAFGPGLFSADHVIGRRLKR